MLSRPHLMLSHVGGDVDVHSPGQFVEPGQGELRFDDVGTLVEPVGVLGPPAVDPRPPFLQRRLVGLEFVLLPDLQHVAEHRGAVADDRHVDSDVLVDRRRIDVHVHLPGLGRELGGVAGHPVVEPGADVHHHVAMVHGHVGFQAAVHPGHAEELRPRRRVGAEAHQGQRAGIAGHVDQFGQQSGGPGAGIDHPAAGIDDRLLGRRQQFDGLFDGLPVASDLRLIGLLDFDVIGTDIGALSENDVLRDIDQHGARAAGGRHMKSLVNDPRQIVSALDQVVVLRRRPGDAGRIGFLEGVVANQVRGYLTGQADDRDRIHQRVDEAGDRIGGAGPGGREHDAHLAGGAGIALGRMHAALLVGDENVFGPVLLADLLVERQGHAPRIAEDDVDVLVGKGFQDDFATDHASRAHGASPQPGLPTRPTGAFCCPSLAVRAEPGFCNATDRKRSAPAARQKPAGGATEAEIRASTLRRQHVFSNF